MCEENELPIAAKSSEDFTDGSFENVIDRMVDHRQTADTTEHMSPWTVSATPVEHDIATLCLSFCPQLPRVQIWQVYQISPYARLRLR